jgi:hypothetical protein
MHVYFDVKVERMMYQQEDQCIYVCGKKSKLMICHLYCTFVHVFDFVHMTT